MKTGKPCDRCRQRQIVALLVTKPEIPIRTEPALFRTMGANARARAEITLLIVPRHARARLLCLAETLAGRSSGSLPYAKEYSACATRLWEPTSTPGSS